MVSSGDLEQQPNGSIVCWGIFAAVAATYVLLLMSYGRFPQTDECCFKSPGRQWAATGQFAAPELTGYVDGTPPIEQVWGIYTPLYPFLFGVFCKLAGFGSRQCIGYDALIHVWLASLTFLLVRRMDNKLPAWVAMLVALAVIPLGHPARPDELSMCFAMAGLLPLLAAEVGLSALIVSATLFALSTFTSPAATLVLGTAAAVHLSATSMDLPRKIKSLFVWGVASAALTALMIGLLLVLTDPGIYRQFLANAHNAGIGSGPAGMTFLFHWKFGRPTHLMTLGCLLIALASLGLSCSRGQLLAWARLWLGPLTAALFVLVAFSGKWTYLWFAGPWLLAASAVQIARVYNDKRMWSAVGLLAMLAAGLVAGNEFTIRTGLSFLQMPPEQSLAYNEAKLRELIPDGSVVLTDEYWWTLADRNRVYDSFFSRPKNLDEIDFVVLGGNGSGEPGRPKQLLPKFADYVAANFQPVYDNLNRSPLQLFDVRLTNSAYGFGPLVLARVPKPNSAIPASAANATGDSE